MCIELDGNLALIGAAVVIIANHLRICGPPNLYRGLIVKVELVGARARYVQSMPDGNIRIYFWPPISVKTTGGKSIIPVDHLPHSGAIALHGVGKNGRQVVCNPMQVHGDLTWRCLKRRHTKGDHCRHERNLENFS